MTGKSLKLPAGLPVLLICLASAAGLIILFSSDPAEALYSFFAAPFSNSLYLGETLHSAVLLSLTGLGIVIAFTAGSFNLGGEGQAYTGALCAVLVSRLLPEDGGFWNIMTLLAAGTLGGGVLALISGWLKARWNVDDLISTFLLSAGVSRVIDYLIAGPLGDPDSYLLTTAPLPEAHRITSLLPPSAFNAGLVFPLLFLPVGWYILNHTREGYELKMTGRSREFARYGGLDTGLYQTVPLSISGALHGLAGALMLTGSAFAGIQGLTSGLGWNGIAVALIAGQKIPALLPAAFFFAWLEQGAGLAVLRSDLSLELGAIIQAVLFLLISSTVLKSRRRR